MPSLPPGKTWLDAADIGSKWLIPITVVLVTWIYTDGQKSREQNQRDFETAVSILNSSPNADAPFTHQWAVKTFAEKTNISVEAKKELASGVKLSATGPILQLPIAGPLRVSIIRLQGSSDASSKTLAGALVAASYTNVAMLERPLSRFPDQPEVRYYYTDDEANALALLAFVQRELNPKFVLNDRISERDEQRHHSGDLHIYIK